MRVVAIGVALAVSLHTLSAFAQEEIPLEQQPGVTIVPAPQTTMPPPPQAAPTVVAQVAVEAPPPPRRVHRWYGFQTLIVDTAIFAIGTVGLAVNEPTLTTVGITGYFIGGPIIHWSHGHVGKGFGDFGLRCAFPVGGLAVGAIIGVIAMPRDNSSKASDIVTAGVAVGAVAGVLAAFAFDALVLADDTVTDGPDEARARLEKPSYTLLPQVALGKNATTLGVAGTF